MTNAQGEFSPSKPHDEPMTTSGVCLSFFLSFLFSLSSSSLSLLAISVPRLTTQKQQHQPGKLVSEADRAGEFTVQTLPPGTAPPESTFQPNPVNETPGQADNHDTLGADDKESTYTDALDTLGGATSADVHKGLGHPGQGQTAREIKHGGGKGASKSEGAGLQGLTTGGSGMRDEGSQEQRNLERETTDQGPISGHNVSREGAEDREPVRAEEVAAERE